MSVFNRWGQLVFSTENPLDGWDGTYQGSQATEDVYVYRINYRDALRKERTEVGRVTLIR